MTSKAKKKLDKKLKEIESRERPVNLSLTALRFQQVFLDDKKLLSYGMVKRGSYKKGFGEGGKFVFNELNKTLYPGIQFPATSKIPSIHTPEYTELFDTINNSGYMIFPNKENIALVSGDGLRKKVTGHSVINGTLKVKPGGIGPPPAWGNTDIPVKFTPGHRELKAYPHVANARTEFGKEIRKL